MKLTTIIPLLFTLTLTTAHPLEAEPEDQAAPAADKNLPKILKYDQRQSNNAWGIIKQIKKEKLGSAALTACKAAFATAIVESNIYIYANSEVPESLKYHHDKVGHDHDSVGIFQQRVRYYPLAQAMDPAKSAHLFFKGMRAVKDWRKAKTNKEIGRLCQKVQRSAYPDRYRKVVNDAAKICKIGGIG